MQETPTDASYSFYCDEAGNTGANYVDANQPVMAIAGWLVPSHSESNVVNKVNDLEKKSRAPEIHGARLLRASSGWRRAWKLVQSVRTNGGVPFFFIVEKRYQLAERIIHGLLDGQTNARALRIPAVGDPGYRDLIEIFYGISEGASSAYAEAISRPSVDSVTKSIVAISSSLRDVDQLDLGHAIEGCLGNLEEIVDYDFSDRGGFKHTQVTSPHLPGIMRVLEAVDAYVEKLGGVVDVVHDETRHYQEVMQDRIAIMRKVGERGKVRNTPGDLPDVGFACVRGFGTTPSHSSRCVQVADVLATSLASLVRDALLDRDWTPYGGRVARAILEPLLTDDLTHGGISISAELCGRLRGRMVPRGT